MKLCGARRSMDPYLEKVSHRGLQKSLFLFPGILGSHQAYANTVKLLSGTADIFAVRYPTIHTMRALSAFCAACVQSSTIRDTYLLGWSMGGLVAYECGAALHDAGTPATSVITIDPASAASPADSLGPASRILWEEFLALRFGSRTKDQILRDGSFWGHSIQGRFLALQEAFPAGKSVGVSGDLRTAFRQLRSSHARLRNYVPSTYPGNFHTMISDEWIRSTHPAWLTAHTSLKNFIEVGGNHLTAILNLCPPRILEIVRAEKQ